MTAVSFTRDQIMKKLTILDERAEALGWTTDPFLAVLTSNGDRIDAAMLHCPLPGPAADFVDYLGTAMNQDLQEVKKIVAQLEHPIVGVLFGSEGWATPAARRTQLAAMQREFMGQMWKVPGARQTRLLMCADLRGRIFQASRFRGKPPDLELLDDESAPRLYQHSLARSLMQIARALSIWSDDNGESLGILDAKLAEVAS